MLRLAPRVVFGTCVLAWAFAAGCGGTVEETGTGGDTTTTTDTGGAGGAGGSTDTGGTGGMVATGGMGGSGGSTNGMPSDVYPAPHAAPPKVISYGGPKLTNPKIVPIFFSNDDPAFDAKIEDFTNKVGATQYWKAIADEYGVGEATGLPGVYLAETAPASIDDSDIATWLADKLNAGDPAFPAPDENTLYAIYYPQGTAVTLSGGGPVSHSCTEFGGYHTETKLDAAHGNMPVPYAVMPHCNYPGETALETMTATASHEYIEASSDPLPMTDPAYGSVDIQHIYWLFALGGGENADMCAQNQSSFVYFPELPYMVQRSWSNISAKAGHDPCVPTMDGEVYFNAAPNFTENVTLNLGQNITVKGVKIPVGESKTIQVDLFSDAKTSGPFTVKAVDSSVIQGGAKQLDFSFDKDSGVNGEKLNLTITVLKSSPYKAEIFYLMSTLNGRRNMWVGIVGN